MLKGKLHLQFKRATLAVFASVFLFLGWLNFPLLGAINCQACTPPDENLLKHPQEDLLLSKFVTYFDGENLERAHNIRLACSRINKLKIPPCGVFSFNQTVGERTKERGFQEAAVILEGQFVLGVGGGVCQVSTTLYNAALLAGMGVSEVHAHSLAVGYVSPSLDAMVSAHSDLKFTNPSTTPVAVYMRADKNSVTAEIYGKKTGYTYQTESVTLSLISPPPPEILQGEEDCVLRQEKSGIKSESYLVCYRFGKRIKSVRIRRDSYACIQGVEQKKIQENLPPLSTQEEEEKSG